MKTEPVEEDERYSPGYPRDLLQRFAVSSSLDEKPLPPPAAVYEEIELSLGLSLNGSFGVDTKRTKLVRSSSVASALPCELEFPVVAAVPLARTCSLPAETEEQHRKRKVLQSLKRLEAKRKRSEKRRGAAEGRAAPLPPVRKFEAEAGGCSESAKPANGALPGFPVRPVSQRQGSIGSQGSSSSGMSDFESRQMQGEGRGREEEKLVRRNSASGGEMTGGEMRSVMQDMPCVSTTGEGPNGRRIEGFLYKYRKGEEVRIVCVCHGNFLTPAEFVRHAGGAEVAHPLRRIVVSTSASALF